MKSADAGEHRSVGAGRAFIGAEHEITAQTRYRQRHLAWRRKVDLLAHRKRRGV